MAVETQELAVIKSGISSAMSESAGQFRQAATASAASITKVVKDISNIFAAQRRDLADLSNSINDVVHELEQTNSKFDNLERVFEESLSIQTAMRGDIKTVAIAVKNMSDGISQLDQNIQNSLVNGPNSLLSGLTTGLAAGFGGVTGKLGDILLKVGGGAVLGGAAVAGTNYMMGGGGGATMDSSVGKGGAEFQSVAPKVMSDLQRDFPGMTKEDAAAVVGNLGEESGGFTKMQEAGGKGPGRGWAQWTSPDRKAKFLANVQKHGGDLANYDANYETLRDELKGQYSGALKEMMAAQGLQNKTYVFMKKFENPGVPAFDVRMRYAQRAINVGGGDSGSKQAETNTNTAGATPAAQTPAAQTPVVQTPAAIPTAPAGSSSTPADTHNHKEETLGKDAEKVKGQGAVSSLPSGDIVALGRALQQRGIRVSEHPSFGGVSHVHGTNSAHYQGQAIDINATSGNPKEADDPVMGPKFDKLAQELQAAGYTVLWKVRKHFNHIHAQIGGQGIRGGRSAIGGASTSDYTDTSKAAVTPGATPTATSVPGVSETTPSAMVPTPTTPSSVMSEPSTEQATPVSQEAVTPGVSAPMTGMDTSAMMGMMGGMLPGGLGGILGMIGPMLESLLGSLAPTEAYAQQVEQPQNAEMLQALSNSMQATQMINQAAVQNQAQPEQQDMAQFSVPGTAPDATVSPNQMSYQQEGYAYNYPSDVSWPDWASMIGGNHWSEMKKIKKNMWA